MKKTYLFFFTTLFLFFVAINLYAQEDKAPLWSKITIDNTSKSDLVHRSSEPKSFKLFKLNIDRLNEKLNQAPNRNTARGISNTIIEFPNPEGKLEKFSVFESPIMHPDLAARYPMIKTYAAQGIDDPTATMRFSLTQFGLHTMTLSGTRSAIYIDPYTNDRTQYIVYDRKALAGNDDIIDFECLTDEGYHIDMNRSSETNRNDTDDQKLRTYRLAQSCTAEYGNIFAGTGTDAEKKANIQAQMTITLNRVNEIYERDLSITLEFIANNDLLIYYGDTSADPWTSEWNSTTQTTIDNTIGDANYDIGHNFNTTGGGNAGCIACVCLTGQKGSAYTGRTDPTGDPFDIDYVAHEMGHQFGGYHTMNTCSRSGNGMTEVEPASGSSIMGYAGICSTNVQMNSDAHFAYVNIRDISENVQPGGNSTCSVNTDLTNSPPTADAGSDYTIPQGTAFVLEGTATDADGMASLTYNWSQNDPEQAPGSGTPQSTWTAGPLYRAKLPISSPNRYMPQFSDVLAGNLTPTWEVTPSVSRNMEFSFIVRDNDVTGGQNAADLMGITVDGNSGPFVVTSQTASETWDAGTNQTITWDVAGTDVAPVNATTVDILITSDGGETFITAATNVPNNGSYTISVPSGATTTTARVMVRGHNNIFYAINSANLSIQDSEFVMNFAETSLDVCAPSDAVYSFTYNTFNSFSENTTFSATGNPAGTTVVFNPAQAITDGTTVTVTVNGITNVMLGQHTINVVGTAASVTKDVNISLGIFDGGFSAINLTAPADSSTGISITPTLTWDIDSNASTYEVEIAADSGFTNIIASSTVSTNSFNVSPTLDQETQYFWRVRPINPCGTGTFSTVFSFTTLSCTMCASSGDTTFETSTTLVQFNTIDNASAKPSGYSDYTTITTNVEKDSSYDLIINANTDGNYLTQTLVWIDWNHNCSFDDAGEEYNLGSLDNNPNGATSLSPLSITIPTDAEIGNTLMRVSTRYNSPPTSCQTNFDGEVEDYTLIVDSTVSVEDFSFNDFSLYPNPSEGIFNISFEVISTEYVNLQLFDIRGRLIKNLNYYDTSSTFSKQVTFDNMITGLYLLRINNGARQMTRKVIIK